VPDVFEDKCRKATKDLTVYDKSMRQRVPRLNEYENPKKPVYREEKEIEPGMKDFELRFKPDPIENPNFISVFDKLPRYHADKYRKIEKQNEDIEKFMAAGKPHDWIQYHKLPEKLQSID
jgi:hypothetical protein